MASEHRITESGKKETPPFGRASAATRGRSVSRFQRGRGSFAVDGTPLASRHREVVALSTADPCGATLALRLSLQKLVDFLPRLVRLAHVVRIAAVHWVRVSVHLCLLASRTVTTQVSHFRGLDASFGEK